MLLPTVEAFKEHSLEKNFRYLARFCVGYFNPVALPFFSS
jgi:hypothetical protein